MGLLVALVVMGNLPVDPEEALRALDAYGPTPAECARHEDVIRTGAGLDDHEHVFVRPAPLRSLAGKSAELIPWLEHPSQPVVRRAATLLCLSQEPQAAAALEIAAAKHPCLAWLENAASNAGARLPPQRCRADQEPPSGSAAFTKGRPSEHPSPSALKLAERISAGEESALHEAFRAGVAMAPDERRDALDAVRGISSPAGLALLLRGLLEPWEARVLGDPWNEVAFVEQILEPALRTTGDRTKLTRPELVVRVVPLLPPAIQRALPPFLWRAERPLMLALGRHARSLTEPEHDLAAQEFLERIRFETEGIDPDLVKAQRRSIRALKDARDQKALEIIALAKNGNEFNRLLAACGALSLGPSAPALELLEARHWLSLALPDRNAIRAEVRALRDAAPEGPSRARLEALAVSWSSHCGTEDCSEKTPY